MGGPSEIGEAKKILYVAREDFPENPRSHILLADYYKAQGVPSLAIEEYEIAKQKDPDYVPAYASLAELKYEEGLETRDGATLQDGLDNANKAIELSPNFAPAYRIRGELWLLAKEYQRARDDLQKYVQLTDSDLGARIRYASFLFLSENYQEAIDEIQAIENDTVTNVMLRLKSMSLNKLGKSQVAKETMDQYFNRVKKEEYILWQDYETYGDIMRTMGDLETADEYYGKAIMKNTERAVKYEEVAEAYRSAGRNLDKEARAIKKEMVSDTKLANDYIAKGNEAVRNEDAETAKAMFAKRDSLLELIEANKAMIEEKEEKALVEYDLESHYRQKALDMADPVELTHYYRLGMAHYNAEHYDKADEVFVKASELKEDWETPYQYRMQCAYYLEQADTSSNDWLAKDVAEDVIEIWGEKDPGSLSKDAKQLVLVSYEVMANYNFNPTGEDGNYNCEAANPWIDKIYAIDPNYSRIKGLADYCESVNSR
jgi:tetratricopeptide (TPR) repeat protein